MKYKWQPRPKRLFQGELMTCANCGKTLKSDPHVESQWTAVEMDGKVIYICPICFGNAQLDGDQQ
jgi:hypothetical protein